MNVLIVLAIIGVLVLLVSATGGLTLAATGYLIAKSTAKFGSSGGTSPPPQPPQPAPSGDFDAASRTWRFAYGGGIGAGGSPNSLAPSPGFWFDMPTSGDVHYMVCPVNMNLTGKKEIAFSFQMNVSADADFQASDPNEGPPCHVSIGLQRVGDDLATQLYSRWFSHLMMPLQDGAQSFVIPLDTANFGDVGGGLSDPRTPEQGLADCMANCGNLLITFGGKYFAGHGVYLRKGAARFQLQSYIVR